MDQNNQNKQEKRTMEETIDQKVNWVAPEERYMDQGTFIGPNTYLSGKLETETESGDTFEDAERETFR